MDSLGYWTMAFVLFGIYAVFRVIIWLELRDDFEPPPPRQPSVGDGRGIDPLPLAHRLDEVRRNYAAEAAHHPPPKQKARLIEERRAEIASRPFFQKPPPQPEPH